LPAGGVWGTTELLEVEMTGTWALADNSDIKLTILVFSITVAGYEVFMHKEFYSMIILLYFRMFILVNMFFQ
jgi:hypothetical protein